jgi:hypothetical protein
MPKEHWAPFLLVPALLVSGLIISRAEESCLLTPNAPAPQGAHWYYRTDPSSQNKCWHLRTDGQTGEQSVRQSEQPVISEAAPTPPLPRPAPEALRQRSSGVPTSPPPTEASVTGGGAENSAGSRDGPSNTVVARPPPPLPPATDSNVFDYAPAGAVTTSSTSSNNIITRPSGQPLAADEGKAGSEHAPDDEPNAAPIQQQPTSDDVQSEKDFTVANHQASYKAASFAMLIILAAGFIFVGIMLNRTLTRLRKAATVEAALPAQAENTQTSGGALQELIQILQNEPDKVRRVAAS